MYYFSDNSINEITRIVDKIMVLFSQSIQLKLRDFADEITRNKCCHLNDYEDVLSLLQDKENRKEQILEKENKKASKKEKYEEEIVRLEYLIMMLLTKVFVSKEKNQCISQHMEKEVTKV